MCIKGYALGGNDCGEMGAGRLAALGLDGRGGRPHRVGPRKVRMALALGVLVTKVHCSSGGAAIYFF
jgi:hypothetical protein